MEQYNILTQHEMTTFDQYSHCVQVFGSAAIMVTGRRIMLSRHPMAATSYFFQAAPQGIWYYHLCPGGENELSVSRIFYETTVL